MSYATFDNMQSLFGRNELVHASQRPGDPGNVPNEPNGVVIQAALDGAAAEMTAALSPRYGAALTPQPGTPPLTQLVECQCWLAWCRLIGHSPRATDNMRHECNRWRRWLTDVAEYRAAVLGLADSVAVSPVYVSQSASFLPWGNY